MTAIDPADKFAAANLQPLVLRQGLALRNLDQQLRRGLQNSPQALHALQSQLGPLQRNQQDMETVCTRIYRMHSSPLSPDEVKGKHVRPYGIENRFKFNAGTIGDIIDGMGRPLESDVKFALFQQKRQTDATALGFDGVKANAFHVGTFDKDARIPKTDLCEIYGFDVELRKLDYSDVSVSDRRIIGEARLYLVVNTTDPTYIGEMADFMREVRLNDADRLQAVRPVRWSRPLAVVRPDDDIALHIVFPDKTATIADKIVGRVRSVGPYYTEYGGLID